MKILLVFALGCSSVASSAPEVATTVQFTEITWPNMLTNSPGWEQSNFVFGVPPRITSTGGQGTSVDVRTRTGDTLVGLSYSASGTANAEARAYVFTPTGADLISDVFDQHRQIVFAPVGMPLKAPRIIAPDEGVVLQFDADGQNYQVSAIYATWSRPL